MKRTLAAGGLLVLGLVLGSAVGALAGKNLTKEAEAIDHTLTSFAPIDTATEQAAATTPLKPLAGRMPTGALSKPLIIATNGLQGTNSDIWRWDPSAENPERIPIELPVDSWWYDERTGLLLGTLSDPATGTASLIRGPLEGPFEKVADAIYEIFPALDKLPTPTTVVRAGTIFGGPLNERIYSERRSDGTYFWSADYTGPSPFKSDEVGPFETAEGPSGVQAGSFVGGAFVTVLGADGTSLITFMKGETTEKFFERAISIIAYPPDVLGFSSFDTVFHFNLATQSVITTDDIQPFEPPRSGCVLFATDSTWVTCTGLPLRLPLQAVSLIDSSLPAPGRLVGFLEDEGLSFSHSPGKRPDDPQALVALQEGGNDWAEIGFFDTAIYGVWSER
jgi:hypothetical protein